MLPAKFTRLLRLAIIAAHVLGCGVSLRAQADGTEARTFFALSYGATNINVSSPLVTANGTVYIGTRGTTLTLAGGQLVAISASGSSRRFTAGDWIDATPAVGPDGTIYVGSWDGKLYAIRDTGTALTKLWEYQTNSFIYSSVAIGADGTLYVGSGDSNLHAINADGTPKWKFPVPDWVDSSPAVAANGNVIVGSWDGRVYAIDPDGNEKWSFMTGASVLGSPAIAADGTIYIGSTDNFLYALNPDGSKRWDYQTGADVESSPVIGTDGTVYVGSNDGYVYAIRSDGTLAWRTQIGATVASTPALRADGSLVVGVATTFGTSVPGQLVCLNSNGTVKWRFNAADIVDSSPAIGADNRIYFTDYARRLYTLNGSSGLASTVWSKWRRDVKHHGRIPNDSTLAQLINLSARARVGIEGDIVIAGTVISGGTSKSLVVRGVGPELAQYQVAGVLADPVLEVFNSAEVKILENDTWDPALQSTFSQLGAFALTPGSNSAALLASLPGGNSFTFQIKGKNSTTGVAIVEVYDAQKASGRLINLSTRAVVGTGDNVLIPGFIVEGSGPTTLLVRAVGPTLGSFGVGGVLTQPKMTLYKGQMPLLSNQGWGTAPNAAFIKDVTPRVGAFALPDNSADSAILTTLQPGAYTVVISGVNNTTGVVLFELYIVSGY